MRWPGAGRRGADCRKCRTLNASGAAPPGAAGLAPEPALAERELGRALGLGDDDLSLLTADGAEVIAGDLLGPVTRAGLRLAQREAD